MPQYLFVIAQQLVRSEQQLTKVDYPSLYASRLVGCVQLDHLATAGVALVMAIGTGIYAISLQSQIRELNEQLAGAAEIQDELQSSLVTFAESQKSAVDEARAKLEVASQVAAEKMDAYGAQVEDQNAKLAEGLARIDQPEVIAGALVADDASRAAMADTIWTKYAADMLNSELMIQQIAQQIANSYGSPAPAPLDVDALAEAIATSPNFARLVAGIAETDN